MGLSLSVSLVPQILKHVLALARLAVCCEL